MPKTQSHSLTTKDWLQQYHAVKNQAGLINYSSNGKIKVTGNDRIAFLNNILTNDILSLKPGMGCYAALLSAPGKVLIMMHVYIFPDSILLDVENGWTDKTMALISKYLITEDVALENLDSRLLHYSIQGPSAVALIKKLFPKVALPSHEFHHVTEIYLALPVTIIRHTRTGDEGFDLIPEKSSNDLLKELKQRGLILIDESVEEFLRIEKRIPKFGVDITEELTLPETGLEKLTASETKGCYPGQEVVARTLTYGGPKRKICGFAFGEKDTINPGDKIFCEGKEVGWMTSYQYASPLNSGLGLGVIAMAHAKQPLYTNPSESVKHHLKTV